MFIFLNLLIFSSTVQLILLLQSIPGVSGNIIIPEGVFDISPTNIYGWLIWGLLFFIAYVKIESTLKSLTIKSKDKYIKELHEKLIEAEKNSITENEIILVSRMEQKLLEKHQIKLTIQSTNELNPL